MYLHEHRRFWSEMIGDYTSYNFNDGLVKKFGIEHVKIVSKVQDVTNQFLQKIRSSTTTTKPTTGCMESKMFFPENPSHEVIEKVTSLVNNLKVEYGYWPSVTEVFYRSANEGIFPRTIESLRLVRRIPLEINHLHKWTDSQ